MSKLDALTLDTDGAQLFRRALDDRALAGVEEVLASIPANKAGVRLNGQAGLAPLLSAQQPIGRVAARSLGPDCFPVRAILFDKNEAANWALGWHQDRTIAVRERRDVAGFGPWTIKRGMAHVAPPAVILANMVTLRVHLDAVPPDNAPLLIAPGTHRRGMVTEAEIDTLVAGRSVACWADRGDIWSYATLILHASAAAERPARRRVLQVDYAARDLPGGLAWLGV